jgi:hypothetical protein
MIVTEQQIQIWQFKKRESFKDKESSKIINRYNYDLTSLIKPQDSE